MGDAIKVSIAFATVFYVIQFSVIAWIAQYTELPSSSPFPLNKELNQYIRVIKRNNVLELKILNTFILYSCRY